jgi:secreted trypsin-like serine protease
MRRRSALAAAALALLGLAATSAPAPAAGPAARAAVVGGTDAAPGRYPWMVALSRGCGGTLVAPDRVLTAGHCVEDLRIADLRVFVGARKRRRGGYRYDGVPVQAADVATHPGYRPLEGGGPVNDAAIVRLATPVLDVPPVKLAATGDTPLFAGGQDATVVGWGVTRTDLRSAPLATTLQRGGLRILPERSCGRAYSGGDAFRPAVMLCARSRDPERRPNTSPCVGDSGGPLVVGEDLQVGIVSFGISCGALREPTVFARVSGLRAFIDLPEPVWAPQPLGRSAIEGEIRPGATVSCVAPPWRGRVDRIRYRWGINGILVATGRRVRVTRNSIGKILQCRAVASNEGGATPAAGSPEARVPRG